MITRAPASVEVRRLNFRYPGTETPALSDIDFSIAPGERVGLLGPNGAGKSTLMRLLCGYLVPERTEAMQLRVAGLSVLDHDLAVRERVGYLPELVPLYVELRVREHLNFRAAVKKVQSGLREKEIRRVAEATGLVDMLEVPIGRLSRGYRQRVGIADALLGAPPLVVLDEPTVGLDPNQVQGIRSMLAALGGGQTLIFSSHVLAEVEQLCDRILILSQGRLVADEAVSEALAGALIVEFECAAAKAREVLATARAAVGHPDPSPGEGASGSDADAGEAGGDVYEVIGERCRVQVAGFSSSAGASSSGRARANGDEEPTTESERSGSFRSGSFHSGSFATGSRSGSSWERERSALAAAIGRAARDANVAIVRLEPARRRLEERFARATGFAEAQREAG